MIWLPSTSQGFQVKTSYKALRWGATNIPLEKQLESKSSIKGGFYFFWYGQRMGKILRTKNFGRKGIVIVEWCRMRSKVNEEYVYHFFLHCIFAVDYGAWCSVFLGLVG